MDDLSPTSSHPSAPSAAPADLTAGRFLERRLGAAVWDLTLLSILFVAIIWAFGPHVTGVQAPGAHAARAARAVEPRHPWVGGAAAAILAAFAAAELFTGLTPGKKLMGLSVRRRDGGPAPVWSLIIRGMLRLLPVALLIFGQLTPDPIDSLWICGATLIAFGCYIPACYILLMKTGRSLFDAAANTIVVRAGRGAR